MAQIVAFILAFPIALWRAYVLCVGWGWFVLPVTGIATPPVVAMWGMLCMISMAIPGTLADGTAISSLEIDKDIKPFVPAIASLVITTFSLFVFWIIQLFM